MESITIPAGRQPLTDNETPSSEPGNGPAGNPRQRESAGVQPVSDVDFPSGVQARISCTPQIGKSPLLSLGIDTLYQTLGLIIPQELLEKLREQKLNIQETSDSTHAVKFGATNLFSWSLQRMGKKLYPFILKTGDITLMLSNRSHDSEVPNAYLTIGSISCNDNLDELFETLGKWFKHHGIEQKTSKITRLDTYVDLETPIGTTEIEKMNKHVTYATKKSIYYTHDQISGVQIGTGDIVLRVYDKIQEMVDKCASAKQEFFEKKWGKKPEHATRVEYQLRGQAMRELFPGVRDWSSVKPAIPGVFKYLTENWFRHTEKSLEKDREANTQHLAESSDFWKQVENSVETWVETFGKIRDQVKRTRKQITANIGKLVEQAAGCMTTVASALGIAHNDVFNLFASCRDYIQAQMYENMEKINYEKRYYSRAALGRVTF